MILGAPGSYTGGSLLEPGQPSGLGRAAGEQVAYMVDMAKPTRWSYLASGAVGDGGTIEVIAGGRGRVYL